MRVGERGVAQCPWYLRPFFWNQKRKYGEVLKPALIWARVPGLFLALASFYGVLDRRRSPLPPALRSLVMARISQINHCRFCIDLNAALLAKRATAPEKFAALAVWHESPHFDAREYVALDYAEAMTLSDRTVTDRLMRELRRHFDEDAIIELTALVALQNLSSKFNAALDVPSQGFCGTVAEPLPEDTVEGLSQQRR